MAGTSISLFRDVAISSHDVIQAISFMKRYYPVDPDRVYLTGFSAGASGAMHVASSYPDAFAAVMPISLIARPSLAVRPDLRAL